MEHSASFKEQSRVFLFGDAECPSDNAEIFLGGDLSPSEVPDLAFERDSLDADLFLDEAGIEIAAGDRSVVDAKSFSDAFCRLQDRCPVVGCTPEDKDCSAVESGTFFAGVVCSFEDNFFCSCEDNDVSLVDSKLLVEDTDW